MCTISQSLDVAQLEAAQQLDRTEELAGKVEAVPKLEAALATAQV